MASRRAGISAAKRSGPGVADGAGARSGSRSSRGPVSSARPEPPGRQGAIRARRRGAAAGGRRDGLEQGWQLRREALGPGAVAARGRRVEVVERAGRRPGGPPRAQGATGMPPPTSSVSKSGSPPPSSARRASARRTASRQASMELSCDPTCRWMPRQRIGPPGPPPASISAPTSSGLTPNFADREPVARPTWVSGSTAGLSRTSASRRRSSWPAPARAIPASAAASSADSTAIQRRGSPSAAARTAARRSASVLPIPSRVMAAFGSPARRASDHSPRETTLAPNPCAAIRATRAGRSFALREYERSHGSGNAARTASAAASRVAASVT